MIQCDVSYHKSKAVNDNHPHHQVSPSGALGASTGLLPATPQLRRLCHAVSASNQRNIKNFINNYCFTILYCFIVLMEEKFDT